MKRISSICIVDDDPIMVFGIHKMLSQMVDCDDITSYANGKLALDGIKEGMQKDPKVPDIIFLDINMPILDGWQFLDEFMSLPLGRTVFINILTSSIDPSDRQNFEMYKRRTEHRLAYDQKPISKEQIREIIEKV